MKYLLDKNGIEIKAGDLLKIFHFTGSRRKKYYLYRYVQSRNETPAGSTYFIISHLDETGSTYKERIDNKKREDFEILQGFQLDKRENIENKIK